MIFTIFDNIMKLDNGREFVAPISIQPSTVCTGAYTDFDIIFPPDAKIKISQKKHTIRIRAYNPKTKRSHGTL